MVGETDSTLRGESWISFWKQLDSDMGTSIGPAGLNDDFWRTIPSGEWGPNIVTCVDDYTWGIPFVTADDQLGNPRPDELQRDIGAVEVTR